MMEETALRILRQVGVVITGSHFVYTSGKHGSAYVNKDGVYPYLEQTGDLCYGIAEEFRDDAVETVIGPAMGGIILSQWTAFHLARMTGGKRQVFAVYAEKSPDGESFVIKRGYDKFITGKRVLVVEDVLTTGSSAKKVIEAVRAIGGNIVGLGVLCNRGGITPADVAWPLKLTALVDITLETWNEADCPLCQQGVPINVDVGKGREFLARQATKS